MPAIEINPTQDGKTNVYARGRNGYFSPELLSIARDEKRTSVSVDSKRAGNASPIYLSLLNEDAEKLGNALLRKDTDPNFLGSYEVRDGEGEYREEVFIKAENIGEAEKKLNQWLSTYWEDNTKEVEPGLYEEITGWRQVKVSSIHEVKDVRETALQLVTVI